MDTGPCQLCLRTIPGHLLTWHHTIPRQRGGKPEHRVPLCKTCHKHIHAVLTNRQLDKDYNTIEKLRAAPELADFLPWIQKQNPERTFRAAQAGGRPRRR